MNEEIIRILGRLEANKKEIEKQARKNEKMFKSIDKLFSKILKRAY